MLQYKYWLAKEQLKCLSIFLFPFVQNDGNYKQTIGLSLGLNNTTIVMCLVYILLKASTQKSSLQSRVTCACSRRHLSWGGPIR